MKISPLTGKEHQRDGKKWWETTNEPGDAENFIQVNMANDPCAVKF